MTLLYVTNSTWSTQRLYIGAQRVSEILEASRDSLAAARFQAERLTAAVHLIKALGGGWDNRVIQFSTR